LWLQPATNVESGLAGLDFTHDRVALFPHTRFPPGPNFITNSFVLFNAQCGARSPVIRNSKSYL